jgi:hypothetical protein
LRGAAALMAALLAAATIVPTASTARAATDRLASDEPEAWAMFFFTSVTVFSGLGAPRAREPWSAELGLELANVPFLNETERTVGFSGTKTENLNNSPVFGRPILTIGLPWQVAVSLAYLPPIRVFSVKPHMFALAIERPLFERGPFRVGARLHGGMGKTEGPFTCPGYVLDSEPGSEGNLFGCNEKSDDRAIQNHAGMEVGSAWRFDRFGGLEAYLTLGANYLDTEFHVRATTFGELDRTKEGADTWTFSLGTGIEYPVTDRIDVSIGIFYTPLSVKRPPRTREESDSLVNFRGTVTCQLW